MAKITYGMVVSAAKAQWEQLHDKGSEWERLTAETRYRYYYAMKAALEAALGDTQESSRWDESATTNMSVLGNVYDARQGNLTDSRAEEVDPLKSLSKKELIAKIHVADQMYRALIGVNKIEEERNRLREFVDNLLAGQYFGGGWADKIMEAAKKARDGS